MTTPEMHATAERAYKAALRLPVPQCYASLHPEEWLGVVRTGVQDLTLLATLHGCVAAAWALSMLEASAAEVATCATVTHEAANVVNAAVTQKGTVR